MYLGRLMCCWMIALTLAGCASRPINEPIDRVDPRAGYRPYLLIPKRQNNDLHTLFVLSFSGGGTRAAAFSYGVLEALRRTPVVVDGQRRRLVDEIDLITGVSGGSFTALAYALHGEQLFDEYEQRFLKRDVQGALIARALNPANWPKYIGGSAGRSELAAEYYDEILFEGATFGDLQRESPIQTWINATDVANNTTFLFTPDTFDALCSDLSTLPLSEAVAASAAFPLVFSPIVLEAHQDECAYEEPAWLTTARNNPEATSAMRAHARALESYQDPDRVRFVKLLDGGITDNFGTTGLSVARARSENSYGPLSPEEAVRVNRILFLVSNAATETNFDWTQKVEGPGGGQLASSIIDSSIAAATRTAYDAMRLTLDAWQADLITYRCSLPLSEVRRLRGSLQGWDCEDLKLFVGEVSFDVLPRDMQAELNEVPTRLRLAESEVDLVIEAGREATRRNPEFNLFLTSLGGGTQVPQNARSVAPVAVTAITE